MADFRNLLINVEGLEAGKFYKVYTDSNATALLISKDEEDQLKADVVTLKDTQNAILADIISIKDRVSVIEENKANPVNVTINNNTTDGGCSSVSGMLEKKVSGEMDIKLAELSANAIIVEYCLFSGKNIECGRLTIIDSDTMLVEEDRTHPTALLPVSFSANRNNDTFNLHLSFSDLNEYNFKYRTIVF